MKRLYSVLPLIITFLVSCQKENGCESVTYVEINTRSIDSHVNSLSIISKEEALHIVEPISKKYPDRWIDVSDTLIVIIFYPPIMTLGCWLLKMMYLLLVPNTIFTYLLMLSLASTPQ